jgi:hypothetical protein
MENVVNWFTKALALPRNFSIKDSHKQAKHQIYLHANTTITGIGDISIGPTNTPCVWVETKKNRKYFKQGQAMAELFLLDKVYLLNSLVVLTDCNDEWIIYCFLKIDEEICLSISEISNRDTALAIIKQFVLAEGEFLHNSMGKHVNYESTLPMPLQKKIKFSEQIPGNEDDRIADMLDKMSEQELFNMSMRRRLRALRDICNVDQIPHVDQFIKLFSDDYENYEFTPSPMSSYENYGTSTPPPMFA